MAENAADSTSWGQVRSAGNLGDRPLIVLTAGKPYDPDPLLKNSRLSKMTCGSMFFKPRKPISPREESRSSCRTAAT
jgi:hypothetical protein